MQLTELGRGGPPVSRAGLGLMAMSGIYGPADEAQSIATIRAALNAGITLLDTGDFYGMGHNELLLREALRGVDRASVFIQVKFGGQRDPRGALHVRQNRRTGAHSGPASPAPAGRPRPGSGLPGL
jgi:aryl-alcohol dehydrogenase-like predicted oxidoreductase